MLHLFAHKMSDESSEEEAIQELDVVPPLVQLQPMLEDVSELTHVQVPTSEVAVECQHIVQEYADVFTSVLPEGGALVPEFSLEIDDTKALPAVA